MTKKHFIALANVLWAIKPQPRSTSDRVDGIRASDFYTGAMFQWEITLASVVALCQAESPTFKPEVFMEYVLRQDGGVK